MSGLVEFLLARIEEDQVKLVTMREWHAETCEMIPREDGYTFPCDCGVPERMGREVASKRAIIGMCRANMGANYSQLRGEQVAVRTVLRWMAQPYSTHPDFVAEWTTG